MHRHQQYELPPPPLRFVIQFGMQSYFSRLAGSNRLECRNRGRGRKELQGCCHAPCCGGHVLHDTPYARNKHSAVSKGNWCVRPLQAPCSLGFLSCCFVSQMAFLMAASATLENAKEAGASEKVADDSVDMASRMLKTYKQAAQALSDRHQTLGSAPSKTEDKSQHYMLIMVMAPLCQQYMPAFSEQPTFVATSTLPPISKRAVASTVLS